MNRQHYMTTNVLIIHNAVDKRLTTKDRAVFEESNAGLMEEVHAVTETIRTLGIKYQVKSIETIEQLPDILAHSDQGIVFNLVEELPADILHACYVPAICQVYGRTCTGSDTPALILAQNKWQAKAVLKTADVPVPDGTIVPIGQRICQKGLVPGKYFVKPVFSDASEGIDADSIVDLPGMALHKAIKQIHTQFKQPALVEQFIPDREFNVSLLQQNNEVQVLPIAEIDFSAFDVNSVRIVGYSAKWHTDSFAYNNTPRIIPAPLSDKAANLVRQCALATWYAIGCQDYARVDFRMNRKEQIFVLEVNPNPDISADAGFAAALEAGGISYKKFIETLLDNALMRNSNKSLF
jgi:D-alanine-D-alanine ligase